MKKEDVLKGLQKIFKSEQIFTDESTRAQKAVDLYALRMYQQNKGWKPTLPMIVVSPNNTKEVSKLLKYCNANNLQVIPRSGGSGVLGGAETRDENIIVLDLSNLNKINKVNSNDLEITCGAGVYIKDLEAFVNKKGFVLGHYPQSMDLAMMGGLVATRSIGQFSTGYGAIEDLLLGLEVVLANGEIVKIASNPRKAAGPDLKQIFLGSEGALGVITEVTVKVFPKPETAWKCAYRVTSMDQGFEIIRKVMRTGIKPSVIRLHDWMECEKPYGAFMEEDECLLIFWAEGNKKLVAAESKIIDAIARKNKAISAGSQPVDVWYKQRNDACDEYEKYGHDGIMVDTIEISAPWSKVDKIYHETCERVYYEVDDIMFFSGHSSHSYLNGTNIYFQIGAIPPKDCTLDESEAILSQIWDIVMETTMKYGGAIAHHHGIGKHRANYLKEYLGSSFQLLERLKNEFDPNNILNPGTLVKK